MSAKVKSRPKGTDWLSLISFGFFLMLLGAVWVVSPSALNSEVESFFTSENWHLKPLMGNVTFPEPTRTFPTIYAAATQFCLAFGFFQIAILVARFAFHDHIDRKADTVSSMAFWFSAAYFLSLLANGLGWFAFLAGIIISGGIAIIASSLVKLLR